jgi:hypothetical protein
MTDRNTNTQEPVAWAVWHLSEEAPGRIAYHKPIQSLRGTGETRDGEEFIPLYGKPTLTDEEREAVAVAIVGSLPGRAATLRKLLERMK